MLITSLLPLLARYSLGFDLVAGPDETVTLTVIPRKAESTGLNLESGETRPISITASAAEIDAELAKGAGGALGQLIATRRTLADQIAEQRQAAEAARTAAAEAAKAKATAAPKTSAPATAGKAPAPSNPPTDAKPDEPASLWWRTSLDFSTIISREATMQINHLTRAYRYDGIDLPVPPHLANDLAGLRAYHATLYPAILNAETVDAGVSGGAHVTEYRRAVGTKG